MWFALFILASRIKFPKPFFAVIAGLLFSWGCERVDASRTLTFGTERPAITLDPRFVVDTHSENATELLFNGLLRVNEALEVIPDLAESFEAVDASHYTFKLRKNVTFHDGTILKASDVLYTFNFLASEANASPYRATFKLVQSVEAPGADTIQVTLKEPYAFFPIAARRPIVPEKTAIARGKEFARLPVGTGPFRLMKNKDREGLELESFSKYFNGAAHLEKLRFRPILDANVRMLELLSGNIDIIQGTADGFPPGTLDRLKQDPMIRLQSKPGTTVQYLNFNLRHPILKNKLVRQAMAHAIDKETIIRYKISGYATVAKGLLPPTHWAFEPNVESYGFNMEQAKKLLDAAGFKDTDGPGPKKRFKILYKTSTNPQSIEIAQVIASQLSAVGIDVELRSQEFGVLLDDVKKGNFEIYSMQWTSVISPDHYYEVFHSRSVPPDGLNRNFYANEKVDRLLEEGRRTVDQARQKAIYSEVQKLVAKDAPCVPLWFPQNIAAIRKRVENYTVHPRGTYDSLVSVLLSPP